MIIESGGDMKIRTKFLLIPSLASFLLLILLITTATLSVREQNLKLHYELFEAKIMHLMQVAEDQNNFFKEVSAQSKDEAKKAALTKIIALYKPNKEDTDSGNAEFPFIVDNTLSVIFLPEFTKDGGAEFPRLTFVARAISDKSGEGEFTWTGKNFWTLYRTYQPWNWTFFYAMTDGIRNEGLPQFVIITVLISIAILICIMILLRMIIGRTFKPLESMSMTMRKIVDGQGDLRSRIKVVSNDEVGSLASYFNDHLAAIESIIIKVKITLSGTSKAGDDLSASSSETFASLEEIRANIEGMRNKIVNFDGEITNVNGQISILKNKIGNVSELITNQSADIEESSSAITEMTASINNVAATSESKLLVVDNLNKSATSGEQFMRKTIDTIMGVSKSTSVILDLIKVIKTISAQTNLLAMNAAIEAAHAGDYGRGFSVVADEIRKLADDASKNSKEITTTVKEVNVRIMESADISNKTGTIFQTIVKEIREVADSMAEIKNTMSELSAAGGQILTALGSMVSTSEEIKSSSKEMKEGITSITQSTVTVSNTSSDIRNAMEEVSAGIKDIYNAVRIASEGTQANADNIRQIDELLRQFQVSEEAKA
jgi:methyl-accepting chemotaxis protein